MLKNYAVLIIGLAAIAFLVGTQAGRVGEMPEVSDEPYTWTLPFQVFLLLGSIFVLGLTAGWDLAEEKLWRQQIDSI